MKRTIAILLTAVLAFPMLAQSQEDSEFQRFTMRAGAAYLPSVPVVVLPFVAIGAGIGAAMSKSEGVEVDSAIPPVASLEFLYSFSDRWSAGLDAGYVSARYDTSKLRLVPVMAEGRFNYISKPSFKFYGALEAGIMLNFQEEMQVIPAFQINPVGVEFGSTFFGHVELGAGMSYIGLRGGVGVRF